MIRESPNKDLASFVSSTENLSAEVTMVEMKISLTEEQRRSIRRRISQGLEDIKAGRFTEYEGREGLNKLANEVKERGRKLLAKQTSGE